MHPLAATTAGWSPEQWLTLAVTLIGALSAAVVSVVGALRTKQVHQDVHPPSNSVTLGALVEGMAQVQHVLVGLQHPGADVPSATDLGRQIQASAAAIPGNGTPAPVNRRSTDVPPAQGKG